MAGLENLIPFIYHEKQQEGSMLCAQHALNSLLQGNYFTPPDLSHIARELDHLEESYDDGNTGSSSTNMDDTGFFSVQVLDNALKVWGLNLTRWRGEEMRPYQDRPQTQLGFILNLQQHWFTLRRFGHANPNIDLDDGNGHWFNLNSFNAEPEWVGKLYLGMVLQQAEAEGYSVFAVTQADPNAPLGLPRTEADMIASTLPEPTGASGARSFAGMDAKKTTTDAGSGDMEIDFADEDLELQAALQASLMSGEPSSTSSSNNAPSASSSRPDIAEHLSSGSQTPSSVPPLVAASANFGPGHADVDPVTASMERNRVLLQRMKEQQEFAQREMWSEEDLTPEEQAALNERKERRRREEEEEERELQRAIEESEALAKQHRLERADESGGQQITPATTSNTLNYNYNEDEDAELQAALRASLEHSGAPSAQEQVTDSDDTSSVFSDTTNPAEGSSTSQPPAAAPSLDEIRQRRLARFGN